MSEHNLSSAEINAQRAQRSNAHEGHNMTVRWLSKGFGHEKGDLITLSTPTARRLIERGKAEAV